MSVVPLHSNDAVHHVLVVNQHGDNRGDEAAMLAMLDALAARLGRASFTVLHQFKHVEESAKHGGLDVRFMPLAPGVVPILRLALAVGLLLVRLPWRRVAGRFGNDVIDAYQRADLVVSAPGGPYFGDIYADHEPLHWAYVVLARLFRRPAFLYAPSVGPFRRRMRRAARRFVFRCFAGITVREEQSAEYLRELFRTRPIDVEVTIDAALGRDVTPLSRSEWPSARLPPDARIVAVSVLDYRYPGADDASEARRRHDDAVVAALRHASERLAPAHIVFVPQLHGQRCDRPYLERLAASLPSGISNEVLPDDVDSATQQRIFAAAEIALAGRYHPAVFSVLAGTPVACLAYEHKSVGLMQGAGLGEFVVPIEDLDRQRLLALVDRVIDSSPEIRARLRRGRDAMRALALRTADLAVATLGSAAGPPPLGVRSAPPLTPMAWMRWDAVKRALAEADPARILEVGAGQGAIGWRLARRAVYVGVEPDDVSFTVARRRLAGLANATILHGGVESVPADLKFDLVCAFEVLEHIEDDAGALVSWRQRLAKGGFVLISVPGHRHRFGPADDAVGHYRRYDRRDLEALLRTAGFETVWFRGYGAGLGHLLEVVRNRLLQSRRLDDREGATARSGRLYQPPALLGRAVALAVAPFRVIQVPWSRGGRGVGYVVLAARSD
jgi:polysaccharide pyruvyl transferase WcaK-like protein